jgi:DNA (cytosine-5)-methyltransferase 1
MLTHFSTFSGIGGFDLAAEWAGFRTVGQVEMKDYPYEVLCKHWPDVPKWRDIRDVTDDAIRKAGIGHITALSGGFPCQPFSVAGQRRGTDDDRYLWPEMLRLIKFARPSWVIGENVDGFKDMALDRSLTDLENIGYTARAFNIPACGVAAPHLRERIFIIAHFNSDRCPDRSDEGQGIQRGETPRLEAGAGDQYRFAPDIDGQGLQGYRDAGECGREWPAAPCAFEEVRSEIAARFCGVVYGVPDRVDRIEALGNAVVPGVAYQFFKSIAMIEGC